MIHLLECENVQILMEALDNWTLENCNFILNYDKKTFILCYHKGGKNSLVNNKIFTHVDVFKKQPCFSRPYIYINKKI